MKRALKILNPAIWLWNFFKYTAHLETCRVAKMVEPYDFELYDTKYF